MNFLRRHLLSVFVAITLAFAPACFFFGDGVGDFDVAVGVDESLVEGNLLGGLLGGLLGIQVQLDIDLEAETMARGTGPVQHVYLSDMSLSVTSTAQGAGDSDSMDFVDTLDIYVESTAAGSTLPRQLVATVDGVADGARTINLNTDLTVDLLPYINEGARLTAEGTGNTPTDDVTFDGVVILTCEVL
jgi:hypothetical protein